MIDFPRTARGAPDISGLPRNAYGFIDVDVYLRDTRTGRAVVHRSAWGCPDQYDSRFFNSYYWAEGNAGCDCNRCDLEGADGVPVCDDDLDCNSAGNVIAIDKITPAGVPDVVLYSDAERDAP